MDYLSEYRKWCADNIFDADTKNELLSLTDEKEIEDRFYKTLSFGTGGLRGIIGAGTNRMNFYTVGRATQGLANFINKDSGNKRVAIAYDSRHYSPEFALRSALILNANGIETFLFDSLRPTPELSFAVRKLNCTAGIVITASHNPPQYNGYKVYWSDGAQITAPKDKSDNKRGQRRNRLFRDKTHIKRRSREIRTFPHNRKGDRRRVYFRA